MKISMILSILLAASLVVHAEVYPTAGGDISTAEGWGGTLPASDALVEFSDGTYTASTDVAFGVVTNSGGVTLDFTATPERVITLNAATETTPVLYNTGADGLTYQFKGGTWNCPSGGHLIFSSVNGRNPSANRKIFLSDGVSFTGAVNVYCTDREYGNLFRMTGGSSINCSGTFYGVNGSAQNMRVEILGGSTVTAQRFFVEHQPTQGGACSMVVAGSGSKVQTTSADYVSVVGTYLDGHSLYVTNGATLDVAGPFVEGEVWTYSKQYDRASNNNLIRIAGNATATIAQMYMGAFVTSSAVDETFAGGPDGLGSHGNQLHVESGASLTCNRLFIGADRCTYGNRVVVDDAALRMSGGATIYVGYKGSFNELVLTNVTCYTEDNLLPAFCIGYESVASNNIFRITGSASHVRFVSSNNSDMFNSARGHDNELIVENGAFLDTVDTSGGCCFYCTNSVVRVRTGGCLKVDRTLHFGKASKGFGCGNRLIVEDGGSFTNWSGGINVQLNSTIAETCPYPNGFVLKNGWADMQALTVNTNCYAEFSGTNPVLRATSGCTVAPLGKLRFVVPSMGYVDTPYTITNSKKGLTMEEGSALEIDISSKPYLDTPLTLVEGAAAHSIPASVLAAANASLGGKGQVYLANGNKSLMLRVWRRGTSVSFR